MGSGKSKTAQTHNFYVDLLSAFQEECEKNKLSFRQELGRLIHKRLCELDPLYADNYFSTKIHEWLELGPHMFVEGGTDDSVCFFPKPSHSSTGGV